MKNPYIEVVNLLDQAFDYFNQELCSGTLKKPLINILSRGTKKCLGWHWKDKWKYEGEPCTEITIVAECLDRPLEDILETNIDKDLIVVPRINTVEGLTEAHIQKWGWNVNEKGWVNFPDYQTRLYRRTSEIEWSGKVHERIVGYNTLSVLPQEEEYCLYHHKQIERQEKQNDYYETI